MGLFPRPFSTISFPAVVKHSCACTCNMQRHAVASTTLARILSVTFLQYLSCVPLAAFNKNLLSKINAARSKHGSHRRKTQTALQAYSNLMPFGGVRLLKFGYKKNQCMPKKQTKELLKEPLYRG